MRHHLTDMYETSSICYLCRVSRVMSCQKCSMNYLPSCVINTCGPTSEFITVNYVHNVCFSNEQLKIQLESQLSTMKEKMGTWRQSDDITVKHTMFELCFSNEQLKIQLESQLSTMKERMGHMEAGFEHLNELISQCLCFSNEQLKIQLESQLSTMKERMGHMEAEFEHLNEDRMRLLNDSDEMKKRVTSAEKEKEAANRKYQKEVGKDIHDGIGKYKPCFICDSVTEHQIAILLKVWITLRCLYIMVYFVAWEAKRHKGITLSGVCLSSGHTFLVVTVLLCFAGHTWFFFLSPGKQSGTKRSLCPASVCLSGSHTFLVVTHTCSYVSRATHAFLGMLPLCFRNAAILAFLCILLLTDGNSGELCTKRDRVQMSAYWIWLLILEQR